MQPNHAHFPLPRKKKKEKEEEKEKTQVQFVLSISPLEHSQIPGGWPPRVN